MDLSFRLNPEILIGADTLSMAGTVATRYGRRIMVAADHRLDAVSVTRLKEVLEDSGLSAIIFDGIEENSSVEMAENIVDLANAAHCDAIIGFGGQKAQVIARMAAIMSPMKITAFELLDGRSFENKFLPFLSIPTEGTGAFSFTEHFLVVDPRTRLVKSIRFIDNLHASVIIDCNLFKFLEDSNSAAFVFEGFFSAVEAYCSSAANFLSDALLERAINFYAKLIKGAASGINAETFAQAGFLTSLGASASSPGIGSALAAAINARCPAGKPLCATALFPVIAARLSGARPEKMARVASFLSNTKATSVAEAAAASVDAIKKSMDALNVPSSLKEYNLSLDKMVASAEAARNLEITANSPWTVSEEEVFNILKEIL
ncbi:MAG: iron-containing alcohol dehydrogenase [Treponema sp.]|jgi:alcohol dehydrogenase|nr:iron-containing alcohol dehydrogenase [Treponema sp.]